MACHPLVGSFSACECGKEQKLRMKHKSLTGSLGGVDMMSHGQCSVGMDGRGKLLSDSGHRPYLVVITVRLR